VDFGLRRGYIPRGGSGMELGNQAWEVLGLDRGCQWR
jgi:hypothetical protein